MSERLVLALDGSTDVCSTALLGVEESRGYESALLRVSRTEHSGRGQARVLLSMVDEMLAELGATPDDLGSIVVGTGPGTFTGVRVAVATARGLALALQIPVFGVNSLAALAASVLEATPDTERAAWSKVVPVIDARRQQVFFAVYEPAGQAGEGASEWRVTGDIAACDREGFVAALGGSNGGRVVVVGQSEDLVGGVPGGALFVERDVEAHGLLLAWRWLGQGGGSGAAQATGDGGAGQPGSPETVKPIYVRAPDADIHIKKMKDPWADGGPRR